MTGHFAKREAGFTLYEVVVVVALIALLSAATTVSLAFYIPNLHLKTVAQDINVQIQKARLEGIRRSKSIGVRFFVPDVSGPETYGPIIWVDEDKDSTLDAGEEVLFRMPVNEFEASKWEPLSVNSVRYNADVNNDGIDDADTDGVTFTGNQFTINSRGLSDQAGSIYLVNTRGKTRQIMITLGGAVRVFQ